MSWYDNNPLSFLLPDFLYMLTDVAYQQLYTNNQNSHQRANDPLAMFVQSSRSKLAKCKAWVAKLDWLVRQFRSTDSRQELQSVSEPSQYHAAGTTKKYRNPTDANNCWRCNKCHLIFRTQPLSHLHILCAHRKKLRLPLSHRAPKVMIYHL